MGHHALNGLLPEGFQSVSSFSSSEYEDIWMDVEEKTAELLSQIQPSAASEERRKAVINYVERLIEREFNCKVFPFGSVPLKTYLPDGDIDLTAISELHRFNDTWANDVSAILEHEERNREPEFHVKEVKCIYAEVPVVKCLVENIIVDISFNQLGGLSTLCFLEEVDRLIGRDHLFKRSIILVKAWCFYESRILGAHHGLLSTYALEVLVLYVFHVFNQSLRGPLEVLFRFLLIFSKFDWNRYCLSLWGPIPLASLHTMAVEPSQNPSDKCLLSEEYLSACREKYRTLQEGNQGKIFSQKFMNLVDPLRPFNNLGRSVNKGNFVRIYSAFAYGAAQLEKLLQSPKEGFAEVLASFFRNTKGHCRAHRLDASSVCSQISASLCSCRTRNEDATSTMSEKGETLDMGSSHREPENASDLSHKSFHYDDGYPKTTTDNINLEIKPANGSAVDLTVVLPDLHKKEVQEISDSDVTLKNDAPTDVVNFQNQDSISFIKDSLDVLNNRTQLVENTSSEYRNNTGMVSLPLSRERIIKLGEYNHQQSQEAGQSNKLQTDASSVGELTSQFQPSEIRDTDADILEGDYAIHLHNLEAGRLYQISHMHGNLPYMYNMYHPKHVQRGSMWEGPGRPLTMNLDHFPQNTSGRNSIPDRYILPNNMFLDGFPKYQKGTGTFFPNLKPNFERDRYLSANGNRTSRRSVGGVDSFTSANQNGALAFRSRGHFPKKRDGLNKTRTKISTDLKIGEEWESLTDDSSVGSVLPSPTTNAVDNFSLSFQKQMDLIDAKGSSDRSLGIVSPSSNSKDLPLEELEFGSFGPGFLAKGLHDANINKDGQFIFQSQQQLLHSDSSLPIEGISISQAQLHPLNSSTSGSSSREVTSKGHHTDEPQSEQYTYELKEEDFPPLAFLSPRESSNTPVNRRSYHEACLIEHSP